MFPESPHTTFQLSPENFRPRASSNASSCGRLSPIPAIDADVLQDSSSQPIPALSPIPWPTYGSSSLVDRYVSDQLVDSLTVAMKLGSSDNGYLENSNPSPSPPDRPPPTSSTLSNQLIIKNEYHAPTNVQIKSEFSHLPPLMKSEYSPVTGGTIIKTEYPPPPSIKIKSEYPQSNVRIKSEFVFYDSPPAYGDRHQDFGYQSEPSSPSAGGSLLRSSGQPCKSPQQDPFQPTAKMLTSAEAYRYLFQQQQQHQQQEQQQQSRQEDRTSLKDVHPVLNSSAHLMMGHLAFNSLPYDLDLNTLQGGLECDVDQVISHELSVDGELDFNFDPVAAAAAVAHTNSMSSRPGCISEKSY